MDVKKNISTIFSFVRTIFDNDINMKKALSSEYEDVVIKRVSGIPKEYRDKINKFFVLTIALIESVDFEKFAEHLGTLSFHLNSIEMLQEYVNTIESDFKRNAAKKLVEDLRILLICLNRVVDNPKKYAAGVGAIQKSKNNIL